MEHKEIALEQIEKLITFIRKNHVKLAVKADSEGFKEVVGYLETAKAMADDNKKRTCLYDAATKYATQLAFRLFAENNLDEETAKIYREFETVAEVAVYAKAYSEEDKARADAITKMQQEYMAEREPFEVFMAVIGGMSEEEAKAKQEKYKEREATAMQNAKSNGQI